MILSNLTRRTFIAALGAVAATGQAFAFTTNDASALVNRVVAEITVIINSGQSESRMISQFERVLSRYGDMPIIAQSVLGVTWRSASGAQRRAFTSALQGYLARKYGKQFRDFIGGTIEVKSVRQIRTFYEVKSTARIPGRRPVEVIFLVSDRSGQEKFFNMVVEGINLRTTESTAVGSLLDRNGGNIDAMIQALKTAG